MTTGRRRNRPVAVLAVVVLVVLAAAAGVAAWRSSHQSPPSVESIAAGLRCPSCEGESVADSRSPVAAAMREVIATQLTAGRSPDQIRGWFADRYGAEVLDVPPGAGTGALLWIVPGGVLVVGIVLAVRAIAANPRTRRPAEPARRPGTVRAPRRAWDLVAVALVGMVVTVAVTGPELADRGGASTAERGGPTAPPGGDPVAAELALAEALEGQGDFAAAAEVYRSIQAQRPSEDIQLRLAFALLRADRPVEAIQVAELLVTGRPDEPEPLLILGLAQRAAGEEGAPATLRRFLDLAPEHPAAAEIRRLLDED